MDDSDYNSDLEKRILKIVDRITKNRNRPCYQNIQNLLGRGDFVIDSMQLKIFVDGLLEKGVLRNAGSAEKESFRLVNSLETCESTLVSSQDNHKIDDIFNITEETFCITDENMSTKSQSSLNEFINTKFYETLIERIKSEVVKCVESKLSDYEISNIPLVANDPAEVRQCKDNNILLNELKNEIEQLRLEQKSKDEIPCAINKCLEGNQVKDDALIIIKLNKELEQLRMELQSKDKVIKMLTKGNGTSNGYINGKQSDYNNDKYFNKRKQDYADNNLNWDSSVTISDTGLFDDNDDDDEAGFMNVTYTNNNMKKKDSRAITILGDSIVKDIKAHKLKRSLSIKEKIYVKSFSGATVNDMVDYARPTIRKEPDLIVLHVGSNDLRSNKTANNIASDVVKLALEMKSEKNDIMISSLVFRE